MYPSNQRIAVALDGIVTLVYPSSKMKAARPGNWVFVSKNDTDKVVSLADLRFRGYPSELPELSFASVIDLSKSIIVGRLLIKDEVNNCIVIDLCPI